MCSSVVSLDVEGQAYGHLNPAHICLWVRRSVLGVPTFQHWIDRVSSKKLADISILTLLWNSG